RERAVLVSAPMKWESPREADEPLHELARLADTAGAVVVGTLVQRLDSPHPKYYIGEGKVVELKELVEATGASLVIFDEELSPAQGKNLEDALKVRIVDRAELIQDKIETRQRTAKAQMQFELAQHQYMLQRLRRMWTHLKRKRGEIGKRDPAKKQHEPNRRQIKRRNRDMRAKLKNVAERCP